MAGRGGKPGWFALWEALPGVLRQLGIEEGDVLGCFGCHDVDGGPRIKVQVKYGAWARVKWPEASWSRVGQAALLDAEAAPGVVVTTVAPASLGAVSGQEGTPS